MYLFAFHLGTDLPKSAGEPYSYPSAAKAGTTTFYPYGAQLSTPQIAVNDIGSAEDFLAAI